MKSLSGSGDSVIELSKAAIRNLRYPATRRRIEYLQTLFRIAKLAIDRHPIVRLEIDLHLIPQFIQFNFASPPAKTLSSRRNTFPVLFFGKSLKNRTAFGTLYAARSVRQCCTISCAVTEKPSRTTMNA